MKNPNAQANMHVAMPELCFYCKQNYRHNDEYFLRVIGWLRNNCHNGWKFNTSDYASCATAWMRYMYENCQLLR